jgi:hypothetical protein
MVTNEYDFEALSTFQIYSMYVLLMWIVYAMYIQRSRSAYELYERLIFG